MKPPPKGSGKRELQTIQWVAFLTNTVMNQPIFMVFSGHVLLELVCLSDQSLLSISVQLFFK